MSDGWNHSLCQRCWDLSRTGQTPVRLTNPDPETCCGCGDTHTSGIYVRAEPSLCRLPNDPVPVLIADGWKPCPTCHGCYLLADMTNEPDYDCPHCYMGVVPPKPLLHAREL